MVNSLFMMIVMRRETVASLIIQHEVRRTFMLHAPAFLVNSFDTQKFLVHLDTKLPPEVCITNLKPDITVCSLMTNTDKQHEYMHISSQIYHTCTMHIVAFNQHRLRQKLPMERLRFVHSKRSYPVQTW